MITDAVRAEFCRQGFVVIPDVLNADQIARGRAIVADALRRDPPPSDHKGPYGLWLDLDAGQPLLEFFRQAGIAELAGQLLRPGLAIAEPVQAQVATTIPHWRHRPGGPHVDGLTPPEPDGRPGTFSLLAGVWLTDHRQRDRGNLWIWPGTHLRLGQHLAERGADALLRIEEMNPGPYPDIPLGEPIQATGTVGSVLFAHYLLAHNIGGHEGDARRETLYYRLLADGHRERWRDVVTDPLLEFSTGHDRTWRVSG